MASTSSSQRRTRALGSLALLLVALVALWLGSDVRGGRDSRVHGPDAAGAPAPLDFAELERLSVPTPPPADAELETAVRVPAADVPPPGASLRIGFHDGEGSALPGLWVRLARRGGLEGVEERRRSDAGGEVRWSELPDGEYRWVLEAGIGADMRPRGKEGFGVFFEDGHRLSGAFELAGGEEARFVVPCDLSGTVVGRLPKEWRPRGAWVGTGEGRCTVHPDGSFTAWDQPAEERLFRAYWRDSSWNWSYVSCPVTAAKGRGVDLGELELARSPLSFRVKLEYETEELAAELRGWAREQEPPPCVVLRLGGCADASIHVPLEHTFRLRGVPLDRGRLGVTPETRKWSAAGRELELVPSHPVEVDPAAGPGTVTEILFRLREVSPVLPEPPAR